MGRILRKSEGIHKNNMVVRFNMISSGERKRGLIGEVLGWLCLLSA